MLPIRYDELTVTETDLRLVCHILVEVGGDQFHTLALHTTCLLYTSYILLRSDGFPTLHIGKRMVVPKDRFLQWITDSVNCLLYTSQELYDTLENDLAIEKEVQNPQRD